MESISKEDMLGLCAAVGFISLSWAQIERAMDNCIHVIFAELGGAQGESEKPVALKRKIRFLRTAFKKNRRLSAYEAQGRKLLDDTNETGEKRHIFLHGTISDLEGTVLTIDKMEPHKTDYNVTRAVFDLKHFPHLGEELEDLVVRWREISLHLLGEAKAREPKR